MNCYRCFNCLKLFENEDSILQHCKQWNHEPHSCFYCKKVMTDDMELAIHYNTLHDHETSLLSDSSDSDSPVTPVNTGSAIQVDVVEVKARDSVLAEKQTKLDSVKEKEAVGDAQPIGPSAADTTTAVSRSSSSSRFGCLTCNLKFPTMEKLHHHLFSHYFFCPKCPNFLFSTPILLAQHLSDFHFNDTPPKSCCNIKCSSATDYACHLQSKNHTGSRACPFCVAVCGSRKQLNSHISSHTFTQFVEKCAGRLYDLRIITYPDGVAKHAIQSSKPNLTFTPATVTTWSIVTASGQIQKVETELFYHCSKEYRTAEKLHKHLESDHKWCPVCPKTILVPNSQLLKDHMKSHWDAKEVTKCCERPVSNVFQDLVAHISGKKHTAGTYCRFCFVDLKSSDNLKLHLQTSHKDNKMDGEVRKLYIR